jgi:hypothetical protein
MAPSEQAGRVRIYLRAQIEGDGVSADLFDDELPPTEEAKSACLSQVPQAALHFPHGEVFPLPHVGAVGYGDLRCEWNRGERTVAVSFSPGGEGRLHVFRNREDGSAATEHHGLPDPDRLVEALRWVAGYATEQG